MRQTPVNDYLEEISTELPEELYGNLSDAVYETVCDFDEEVAQLKAENAKLREFMSDILAYGYGGGFLCSDGGWSCPHYQECFNCPIEEGPEKYVRRGCRWLALARELGVETSE